MHSLIRLTDDSFLVRVPPRWVPKLRDGRSAKSFLVIYPADRAVRRLQEINRKVTGRPKRLGRNTATSNKLENRYVNIAYKRTLSCMLGHLMVLSKNDQLELGQIALAAAIKAKDASGLMSIILSTMAITKSTSFAKNIVGLFAQAGLPSNYDGGLQPIPYIDTTGTTIRGLKLDSLMDSLSRLDNLDDWVNSFGATQAVLRPTGSFAADGDKPDNKFCKMVGTAAGAAAGAEAGKRGAGSAERTTVAAAAGYVAEQACLSAVGAFGIIPSPETPGTHESSKNAPSYTTGTPGSRVSDVSGYGPEYNQDPEITDPDPEHPSQASEPGDYPTAQDTSSSDTSSSDTSSSDTSSSDTSSSDAYVTEENSGFLPAEMSAIDQLMAALGARPPSTVPSPGAAGGGDPVNPGDIVTGGGPSGIWRLTTTTRRPEADPVEPQEYVDILGLGKETGEPPTPGNVDPVGPDLESHGPPRVAPSTTNPIAVAAVGNAFEVRGLPGH